MKLSSKTIVVSICISDPMGMGDPNGNWRHESVFCVFFFTLNLLLMFLKILIPSLCVSMDTCSVGTEEVCS